MTGILQNKRQAIAALCARYGVVRLDAFGSALRDDFRPGESDLDLLVEFGPMEPYDRVDAYFGLLEELRALLGLEIDLVRRGPSRTNTSPATSSAPGGRCMPRDARAYLADIIESCDAITAGVRGLDLAGYQANRLVRSSVEREFIIIGEAAAVRLAPTPPSPRPLEHPHRHLPGVGLLDPAQLGDQPEQRQEGAQ